MPRGAIRHSRKGRAHLAQTSVCTPEAHSYSVLLAAVSDVPTRERDEREGPGKERPSWLTAIWMLAAVSFYRPLYLYLGNVEALRATWKHLVLAAVWVLLWVLVARALVYLGPSRAGATYGCVGALLLFSLGRPIAERFGTAVALALTLVAAGVCALLIDRLARLELVHMAVFGLTVYLSLAPLTQLPGLATGQSTTPATPPQFKLGSDLPDIYLIVLDGYPGIQVLGDEPTWSPEGIERLSADGFTVLPAWAAYSMTHLSLPSLLDMSYPVEPVDGRVPVERHALRSVAGGDGAFFRHVSLAGYTLTMLEAPWSGSRCSSKIDVCVSPPWLDEWAYYAVKQSLLGRWIDERVGSAWLHGAVRTERWLATRIPALSSNEQPDFVFAHVIVPHPPFLLDSSCDFRYSTGFDAVVTGAMGTGPEVRQAQLDQIACVTHRVADLVEGVPNDAIVIVTADHGSELAGQVTRDPSTWTTVELRERMSVFLAMRGPSDCLPHEPVVITNVLRSVLRCLGDDDLPDLEQRMFASSFARLPDGSDPMLEVDPVTVSTLTGAAVSDG